MITSIETIRMAFDKQHRYLSVPGTEEIIDCDLLIIAAGFYRL